jgi:enoyl-CoA hydratase/carnithine racemase
VADIVIEQPSTLVRTIRLNRPERLNALTFGLTAELHDALDTVAADDACKVVVLTGAGRGFCAGLDLRDFGTPPEVGEHPWRTARTSGQAFMSSLTQHINQTPQMVIAAVNGPAYGGGLALASACDLRVAAEASGRPRRSCGRTSTRPASPPASRSRTATRRWAPPTPRCRPTWPSTPRWSRSPEPAPAVGHR